MFVNKEKCPDRARERKKEEKEEKREGTQLKTGINDKQREREKK